MRMTLGDNEGSAEDLPLRENENHDERWQILSLLSERSTVREALRKLR